MKTRDQLLNARGLSYRIDASVIVDGFDLSLERGEVWGLIGPNGAGKTTLIDLLSGFRRPSSGAMQVAGRDVARHSADWRVRNGIVRTFQESPAIYGMTVLEHLQLAYDAAGRHRDTKAQMTPFDVADRLGLAAHCANHAFSLPIAERRMLDLGRALLTCPDVLLLDEPFAGLGRTQELLLAAEIKRLRERGSSVLIVEHRLALLKQVVDSVLVMVNGARIAAGTLVDVLKDPVVQRAYLGEKGMDGAKE